jgi:diguanylate cyclase (GGDEF)-like protein
LSKTLRHELLDAAFNFSLFLLIPMIGWVDAMVGSQVRLTSFFLIPIMLITWRKGKSLGYLAALCSLSMLFLISSIDDHVGKNIIIFAADSLSRFVAFFIIVEILSNLRQVHLHQKTIAIRDNLTDLFNRRGLEEILSIEIEKSRRDGHSFSLVFLDCDNFKAINDNVGHHTGDLLLKMVAQTLRESIRRSDLAFRLGGDEFVLYFSRVKELETTQLIDKIEKNLTSAMHLHSWPVTFSIGASVFHTPPGTLDEALRFADNLMYTAKRGGKNCVRCATWQRS